MSSVPAAAKAWWRHTSRRPLTYGAGMCLLALGVATLTVVGAMYEDVFSRPLPFSVPDALVSVSVPVRLSSSLATIPEEFARLPAFSALGFYAAGDANVTRLGQAERVPAAVVDAGFFRVFGVKPIRGRTFTDSDDQRAEIAILGERFWSSLRAAGDGDPEFVVVGGKRFAIVGIMPTAFAFPSNAELWVLPRASNEIAGTFFLPTVIGRLASGISISEASHVLGSAGDNWSPGAGAHATVEPLAIVARGSAGRVLPLLLAAVVVALIATCAAVCALWISLLIQQRKEIETRCALGASRSDLHWQIGLQLFIPSLLATFVGVSVAGAALRVSNVVFADAAPMPFRHFWLVSTAIGVGVLFFCALATTLAGRAILTTVGSGLRSRSKSFRRFYGLLSAVHTSLAFVLVAAIGVFRGTVGTVLPVDLGLGHPNAQMFRVSLPSTRYQNRGAVWQLIADIQKDFLDTPGVDSVGVSAALPGDRVPILINNLQTRVAGSLLSTEVRATSVSASQGFFKAAGIPIEAGRSFTSAEMRGTSSVAILNREAVRRLGLSPQASLGLQIRLGKPRDHEVVSVIGVVADVLYSEMITPAIYEPVAQQQPLPRQLAFVFAAKGGSIDRHRVDAIIAGRDRDLSPFGFGRLGDLSLVTPGERSVGLLLIGLASVSMLECVFAVYGIGVQFMTHEMRNVAVATALGLTPAGAVRRTLIALVRPTALGVVMGMTAALFAVKIAQGMIPHLAPLGVTSLLLAAGLLLLTALLASVPSARRAVTVDLARHLRAP